MSELRDQQVLVDHIAETLRDQVLRGDIPSGARLPQEAIAKRFGVSRTPVREALHKLEASGLIELSPNRGAFVRNPSAREIREAYLVRAELEGVAAELATNHITEEQLRLLRHSVELFRQTSDNVIRRRQKGEEGTSEADLQQWRMANDTFHQGVQDAAANERLAAVLADLHRSYSRGLTAVALSSSSALIEENIDQHIGILDAIETHEPTLARSRMVEHVMRAGELVVFWFEQRART